MFSINLLTLGNIEFFAQFWILCSVYEFLWEKNQVGFYHKLYLQQKIYYVTCIAKFNYYKKTNKQLFAYFIQLKLEYKTDIITIHVPNISLCPNN